MSEHLPITFQHARVYEDEDGVMYVNEEDALSLVSRHNSFPVVSAGGPRRCPHGYDHPGWPHSCDGCWCEGERDRREYGWDHDTSPKGE